MARLHSEFRVVPATPNYVLQYPDSHQATFADILRIYNGFEPGRAWMDLRPDMELRIEDAYYEPGASRRGLTGFLGTEVAQYKVGSKGCGGSRHEAGEAEQFTSPYTPRTRDHRRAVQTQ